MNQPDPFLPDLTPDLILRAYAAGIFPMAESAEDEDVFWVSPDMRGIIPLDQFHISRSLRKFIRTCPWQVKIDTDFAQTIEKCATLGTERDSTWINAKIKNLYGELFKQGHCHTVEIWNGDEMVGGLYGLAIGGAFFGESMFHAKTNASKLALYHLVERLKSGGFNLLDTQFLTPHLASMGGIEIERNEYEALLSQALQVDAKF